MPPIMNSSVKRPRGVQQLMEEVEKIDKDKVGPKMSVNDASKILTKIEIIQSVLDELKQEVESAIAGVSTSSSSPSLLSNQELVKVDLPGPNPEVCEYETDLPYGFEPGSKIVMDIRKVGLFMRFSKGFQHNDYVSFVLDPSDGFVEMLESNGCEEKAQICEPLKVRKREPLTVTVERVDQDKLKLYMDDSFCKTFSCNLKNFTQIIIDSSSLYSMSFYTKRSNICEQVKIDGVSHRKGSYDLTGIKKTGATFYLTGKMPEKEWMHINFDIGPDEVDTPLHLSIRHDIKATAVNNKINHEWQREYRVHWFPFKKGATYTFAFCVQDSGIVISVDNIYFSKFYHRMDFEKVTRLRFDLLEPQMYYTTSNELLPESVPETPSTVCPSLLDKESISSGEDFASVRDKDSVSSGVVCSSLTDTESVSSEVVCSSFPHKESISSVLKAECLPLGSVQNPDSSCYKALAESACEKNSTLTEAINVTPSPDRHLYVYVTELEDFDSTSGIVLKGVFRDGTAVKLRQVGFGDDREIEFSFSFNENTVTMSVPDHLGAESQQQKLQMRNGETLIVIQQHPSGFQVRSEDSYVDFVPPPFAIKINKLEILNCILKSVSYFKENSNRPRAIRNKLASNETTYDISSIKKKGTVFVVTGKIPENRRGQINFDPNGTDTALHMSIEQETTVFNSKVNDWWSWSEENEYGFLLKKGQTYTFAFNIQAHGTTVSVDNEFFYYFKHRMDFENVTRLHTDLLQAQASYISVCDGITSVVSVLKHLSIKEKANLKEQTSTDEDLPELKAALEESDSDSFVMIDESSSDEMSGCEEDTKENSLSKKRKFSESDEMVRTDSTSSSCVRIQESPVTTDPLSLSRFVPPTAEIFMLPAPKKSFLAYVTELEFGLKYKFSFSGYLETGSAIKFKQVGDRDVKEVGFEFDSERNLIIMNAKAGLEKTRVSREMNLKGGKEADVSIQRLDTGFKLSINTDVNSCFEFPQVPIDINKVEIFNRGLIAVAYDTPRHSLTDIVPDRTGSGFNLHGIKKCGSVFILQGTVPQHKDWTHINFSVSDMDIALHMSMRHALKATVLNNMRNKNWSCCEEYLLEHNFPFKKGSRCLFVFQVQHFGTMIFVNGEFFFYFKHRMDFEKVTFIESDLENMSCKVQLGEH